MGKIKITRKDLKQDEVKTFGMHAYSYLKDNYTVIIIVLALLLVGFVGFKLYQYRQFLRLRESNRVFNQVINYYEQALMVEEDPQRREDFLKECIKSCEQILRDYPGARIAEQALFFEGNAYYLLKDFDQAATLFQQYIETTSDNFDKARGHIALGYCFENKFFYNRDDASIIQQALRSYEQAIDMADNSYLAYEGMLCKARLLELQGKKDEALALYDKVKNDREFVLKDFQERVASLEAREGESGFEYQIIKQVNEALQIFTFYKSAQLDEQRLRGSSAG